MGDLLPGRQGVTAALDLLAEPHDSRKQEQRVSITFQMVDESGGHDQAAPSAVKSRVMATLSPP
jgi:hypothetical protein